MGERTREPLGRMAAGLFSVIVHLLLLAFLIVSFRWNTLNTSYVLKSRQHVIHAFMVGPLPLPRPPRPVLPAPAVKPLPQPAPQPAPLVKPRPHKGPSKAALARAHQKALEVAKAKAQAVAKALAKAKAMAAARAHARALAKAQALAKAKARAAAQKAAKARSLAQLKAEEAQAAARARASLARQVAEAAQRAKARAAKRAAAEKAAQAAARGVVNRYKALIEARVSAAWVAVPGAAGLHCTVLVRVIAGGQVISARIVRGSGNPVFDRSVIAAIYNAVPLPVPKSSRRLAYLNPLTFVFTAPKGSPP